MAAYVAGSGPAVAADVTGLPFRDGVFDVVVAAFVVNHLPDPVGRAARAAAGDPCRQAPSWCRRSRPSAPPRRRRSTRWRRRTASSGPAGTLDLQVVRAGRRRRRRRRAGARGGGLRALDGHGAGRGRRDHRARGRRPLPARATAPPRVRGLAGRPGARRGVRAPTRWTPSPAPVPRSLRGWSRRSPSPDRRVSRAAGTPPRGTPPRADRPRARPGRRAGRRSRSPAAGPWRRRRRRPATSPRAPRPRRATTGPAVTCARSTVSPSRASAVARTSRPSTA